jgi:hypothetical protein
MFIFSFQTISTSVRLIYANSQNTFLKPNVFSEKFPFLCLGFIKNKNFSEDLSRFKNISREVREAHTCDLSY